MPKKKAMKSKKTEAPMTDKKIFMGVALIFVGVLLLANNLGLIPLGMSQYWPVILVFLGLWGLSNGLS